MERWVYDLVIAMRRRHQEHPPLYVDTGLGAGADRYQLAPTCGCEFVDMVPREFVNAVDAIMEYNASVEVPR
jgi:hypothetical protein